MNIKTHLHMLELESLRDADEVHRAYRRQVKRWHPDQFTAQPEKHAYAEERLKRINEAYRLLKAQLEKRPRSDGTEKESSVTTGAETVDGKRHGDKTTATFSLRQWLKSWCHNVSPPHSKADIRTGGTGQPPPNDKSKQSFEQILRQTSSRRSSKGATPGSRRAFPPGRITPRRSKGLRINGFTPASPVAPVKPVARVRRIEGDH